MSLSPNGVKDVMVVMSNQKHGNEMLGVLGQYGGFSVNSDSTVNVVQGDIAVSPDSGGAAGTYRVFFPKVNADIVSIDWFDVKGFTPRVPTGVELNDARVCGYNFDATLNQWYITVQIVLLSSGAVNATPPAGFATGVRASFTYKTTANPL